MSGALDNQVAIITGGGRGLGKAFALRYAAEGAKLLLPDISPERAENTAREIRDNGGTAQAMETDISSEPDTLKIAEQALQLYGRADVLLNNAAMVFAEETHGRPWDAWPVAAWDRIFAVNTKGTWLCCKAIAPLMVKQGRGKIINIASDVVKLPAASFSLPYALSKATIYTLTQALARELGASGVNVNAIAPGLTASEAAMVEPGIDDIFAAVVPTQSIPRREQPQDLVGAAVFLASRESDFITGQTIFVDGGTVMVP
ncbi:SDR family NAD(P)-dependent oxidoreductase [Chloroflexota bacterium]